MHHHFTDMINESIDQFDTWLFAMLMFGVSGALPLITVNVTLTPALDFVAHLFQVLCQLAIAGLSVYLLYVKIKNEKQRKHDKENP